MSDHIEGPTLCRASPAHADENTSIASPSSASSRSLFYTPTGPIAPMRPTTSSASRLGTPIGPSAGPHTQLSQNIISAWLCGGRFIELKTVQIMDELVIPRPCIDMEDEGYNVEWSQELKLEESAQEYVNAWALIHVLRRLLGWEDGPLRHHLRHERRLQPGGHPERRA